MKTWMLVITMCLASAGTLAADQFQARFEACRTLKTEKAQTACMEKVVAAQQEVLAKKLRAQVIDRLRDPESARFGRTSVRRSEDPPAYSLCGEVNAKNAYGGYAGFARFISTSRGDVYFEGGPGADFDAIWAVWCPVRQ